MGIHAPRLTKPAGSRAAGGQLSLGAEGFTEDPLGRNLQLQQTLVQLAHETERAAEVNIDIGQGQQVRQIIKELTLDADHLNDFDALPTPYRAVATDIETGNAYIFRKGDIVTAISFPLPPRQWAGRYIKLGRNALGDLAIVGVTALGYPDATAASGYRFRLALASVAPVPLRPVAAETILAENSIDENIIAVAAQAAMDAVTPISDTRGSARYRKMMVRNLTRQAVTDVWEQIGG